MKLGGRAKMELVERIDAGEAKVRTEWTAGWRLRHIEGQFSLSRGKVPNQRAKPGLRVRETSGLEYLPIDSRARFLATLR